MKALWRHELYVVVENHDSQVELEPVGLHRVQEPVLVHYGDRSLIIDPTDGDLDEAQVQLELLRDCCTCPHEDYITLSTVTSLHVCGSCGERFTDTIRTKRYFGQGNSAPR
jgi:hypothetical protein